MNVARLTLIQDGTRIQFAVSFSSLGGPIKVPGEFVLKQPMVPGTGLEPVYHC
jgi:hypothetical protein